MASRPFPTLPGVISWNGWRAHWPALLFMIALPIGIYARIVAGWRLPLWFDETFSGTIAGQPTVDALFDWCRHELTGPGFYMPLWAWAQIAGTSDAALRLPSLACSIATPLVLARVGDPDRRLRLIWAILVLFWTPSLVTATEARPYAQLFLLGSLQAIAFLRLIRAPGIARALAWSVVTAAMVMTHYHALVIGGCEGVAFLALHRGRALACWPALAAFLPLLFWMTLHLPFVLAFGAHHDAVYANLADQLLPSIPREFRILVLIGPLIAAGTVVAWRLRRGGIRLVAPTPGLLLATCGVATIVLEITVGLFHAGFMARYLTPAVPAALYGSALWIRTREAREGVLVWCVFACLIAPFGLAFHAALAHPGLDERHRFNFEIASTWLAERRPDRLAFLWSDETGGISGDRQMREIAGFFLRRHGLAPIVMIVHPIGDPGTALRAAAGADPHAAILWIAADGGGSPRSASRIVQRDGRWSCRDFGGGSVTITACDRP